MKFNQFFRGQLDRVFLAFFGINHAGCLYNYYCRTPIASRKAMWPVVVLVRGEGPAGNSVRSEQENGVLFC